MTVTVLKNDGSRANVYWNINKCEETPTFLKLTGDKDMSLIPLRDIKEVYIGDMKDES